jgi:zinc and cadmium transporter
MHFHRALPMAVLGSILLAVVIVSLVSFVGALTLISKRFRKEGILNNLVAFAAGALLAAAFLDLLVESVDLIPLEQAVLFLLGGVIVFFMLERFLLWFHCHSGNCEGHHAEIAKRRSAGYINLLGDGLHNFFDGAAIAAAFLVNPTLGWVTTLVIALHEIPQEFGDFGILLFAGFKPAQALFFNFLSALTAVAGGLVAYFAAKALAPLTPALLAFSAGGFTYIALADLLPELHHESRLHKSLLQFFWFILGMALIWGVIHFAGAA